MRCRQMVHKIWPAVKAVPARTPVPVQVHCTMIEEDPCEYNIEDSRSQEKNKNGYSGNGQLIY